MKYFTIDELSRSVEAERLKIRNIPVATEQTRLISLVENVLDPAREKFGKAIKVNSGYRCYKLNKQIGGAITSQHLRGEAADITAGSKDENRKLFEILRALDFDQLINEQDYSWIHVSYKDKNRNRHQILAI